MSGYKILLKYKTVTQISWNLKYFYHNDSVHSDIFYLFGYPKNLQNELFYMLHVFRHLLFVLTICEARQDFALQLSYFILFSRQVMAGMSNPP